MMGLEVEGLQKPSNDELIENSLNIVLQAQILSRYRCENNEKKYEGVKK